MFDPPMPPSGPTGGKEPEDIFANVEKPGASPAPSAPRVMPASQMPTSANKAEEIISPAAAIRAPIIANPKIIWTVGIVVAILILAGAGYGLVKFLGGAQISAPAPQATENNFIVVPEQNPVFENVAPIEIPITPEFEQVSPVATPIDTDGDGLADSEETALGTSLIDQDTDGDGLFDYEEVNTYYTDPLKADTDGDGYPDGQEIRNGYNPKGEGTLIEVPVQ